MTRLLLHIGMGKTGSSALQVALVHNREALAAAGVRYPEHASDVRARKGRAGSGNGQALQELLTSDGGSLPEVDGAPTVLYSSEFLWYFRPDRLAFLRDSLAGRGITLEVVAYVRDIAGMVVSSYAQSVKRSRYTGPLSTYIEEYGANTTGIGPGARLQTLVELLGHEHVHVRHYDSERHHLVPVFFTDVLGVAAPEVEPGEVNRSLTALETEWMRHMNTSLADDRAALIASEALTARAPVPSPAFSVSAADLAALEARFGEEVAWVNEHFLHGRLSVQGAAQVSSAPAPAVGPEQQHLLDVLSDLVNRESSRQAKRQAAREAAGQAARGPQTPGTAPHGQHGLLRRLRRR